MRTQITVKATIANAIAVTNTANKRAGAFADDNEF